MCTKVSTAAGTWGANSVGHWDVFVARAGTYEVQLIFDEGSAEETAQLRIGRLSRRSPVAPGEETCRFGDVKLSAGDVRLEAVLTAGNEQRGVYQVVVTRQ